MLLYSSSLQKLPDALVAQLDRVSDYESEGQGFESLRARQRKGIRFVRMPFLLPYHKGLEPERVCGYLEGAGGAFLPAECR